MSSAFECCICHEPYNHGPTTSHPIDRRPTIMPGPCGRSICMLCAEFHRSSEVERLNKGGGGDSSEKRPREMIKCMFCKVEYHAEHHVFYPNRDLMSAMTEVELLTAFTAKEEGIDRHGGNRRQSLVRRSSLAMRPRSSMGRAAASPSDFGSAQKMTGSLSAGGPGEAQPGRRASLLLQQQRQRSSLYLTRPSLERPSPSNLSAQTQHHERLKLGGSWGDYVGEFNDKGERHGSGLFTWDDGVDYDGEWKNGERNGIGTFTWVEGHIYEGDWKSGKKHGLGTLMYANGDVYDGQYSNDQRHGHGTLLYAIGKCYEGGWKDGKRHGSATCRYVDGRVQVCMYRGGKIVGEGLHWSKDLKKAWRLVDGEVKSEISLEEAASTSKRLVGRVPT